MFLRSSVRMSVGLENFFTTSAVFVHRKLQLSTMRGTIATDQGLQICSYYLSQWILASVVRIYMVKESGSRQVFFYISLTNGINSRAFVNQFKVNSMQWIHEQQQHL